MTETNIWPTDLAELSAEGTKHFYPADPRFPAIVEQIGADHDVVVQFSHEDGWRTRVNVYQRLSPTMWLALDAEDGSAEDSSHETEALPVLMFRDRMTGMIPLSMNRDAKPTDLDELSAVPRGSVAAILDNWPTILCKIHSEWVEGVNESWTTEDLVELHGDKVRLLWVAPGDPTPKPVRQNYDVHDEVLVDGRTGYIIGGGRGGCDVRFGRDASEVKNGVSVNDIEYVATPERPLTYEAARARFLWGANIRCNLCGDHGATWLKDERPGWGALALCPPHAQELAGERARFETELRRLRTINFEQEH